MLARDCASRRTFPLRARSSSARWRRFAGRRPRSHRMAPLAPDGFRIRTVAREGARYLVVAGESERAVLYGAFALLRKIAPASRSRTSTRWRRPSAPSPLGQRVEQHRRHDRARLRRPIDLLGQLARPRRSHAGQRLWPAAGVARHQRHARSTTSTPTRCVLSPEFIPQIARIAAAFRPWGVQRRAVGRLRQPADARRSADTFDPLDPSGHRVVEGAGGRALRRDSRLRRLRAESRFRGPRRALGTTAARTPMPPTSSRARWSRTAA